MSKKAQKGKPGPSQAGSIGGVTRTMASMSMSDKPGCVSLFPPKPARPNNQLGPGNKVDLITNLFKISLMNKQLMYRFDVEIDIIKEDEPAGGDRLPRKLSKEIRKRALDKALRDWIKQNPQKIPQKKKYTYVYDNNGSALYALFSLFPTKCEERSTSIEFKVELELDKIVDSKLALKKELFLVKLIQSKSTSIDIDKLFDYCKGIGSDITRIQECIRAMNVILHGEVINIDRFVVTPYSVFDFQGRKSEIGPKVLLREGFSMSARPTAAGLVLNVANSFNAFHEETDLISMLQSRFSVRPENLNKPLQPYVLEELKKEIKNKQIEARHINYGTKAKPHYRKYRVSSIEGDSFHKFTIIDKEKKTSQEVTVENYFKKEYKLTLRYPKLPCIVDKGSRIPMEVCHLIDKQRVTRKMTGVETANTIRQAALRPQEHFERIRHHVGLISKVTQPLNDFGLNFDAKPIEVTGRELAPIFIGGQGRNSIRPNDGQYNVMREKFLKPAIIGSWAIVALLDYETSRFKQSFDDLGSKTFERLYANAAREKGMTVGNMLPPRTIPIANNSPEQVKADLKREFALYNEKKVAHVIFLLSEHCPEFMYRYLQYLETLKQAKRGPNETYTRVTCVKLKNYENKIVTVPPPKAMMFVSNLLLKYNTKMGGINFALLGDPRELRYLAPDYIFISVDVCHPAPGDKLCQSVAAAFAMWDLTSAARSYRTCIRVQRKVRQNNSTVEEVTEVDKMLEDILKEYYAKKRTLPANVVILRDGVSEGQLKIVLDGELRKIYAMMERAYSCNKLKLPKVACMVVQKRHKVRFMRKQPVQSRNGPDFNIQPGTVVDSTITHPTDFTFYLAPHKAIQGTSKAAHIYVIHDTIGFSQDEAQSMVHALSYLSPRCTKSTSIPTPVNMADRAAERGKNLVICWQEDNMRSGKKGRVGEESGIDEQQLITLNDYLQNIGDANYRNTLFYI